MIDATERKKCRGTADLHFKLDIFGPTIDGRHHETRQARGQPRPHHRPPCHFLILVDAVVRTSLAPTTLVAQQHTRRVTLRSP